jgi:hypothetical protein
MTRLRGLKGTIRNFRIIQKTFGGTDMKTLRYREGQEFCCNCGERFMPDYPVETYGYGEEVITTCPNAECNRGSWAVVEDSNG